MKIAFILPEMDCGGAQRVVSVLSNELAKRDHEVYIVQLFHRGNTFYSLDLSVQRIEPTFDWKSKKFGLFHTFLYLRRTVKTINPSVAIGFHHRYNAFVILALFFLRIKIIVSDRSNPYNILHPWFNESLRNALYPKTQGLIVQTQLAATVKRNLNGNICILPNPIKEIVSQKDIAKENLICNVATMRKGKGQEELVRIFSLIADKRGWKLMLVGDGVERVYLQNLVQLLNLQNDVVFTGERKDIDYLLQRSKIFAFTSRSEGYPNALIEAMAVGLACVSFDIVAGPSDIILDDINGYLIPHGNFNMFADRLFHLMANEDDRIRIGSEALRIRQSNNINSIANVLENFINKTIL